MELIHDLQYFLIRLLAWSQLRFVELLFLASWLFFNRLLVLMLVLNQVFEFLRSQAHEQTSHNARLFACCVARVAVVCDDPVVELPLGQVFDFVVAI